MDAADCIYALDVNNEQEVLCEKIIRDINAVFLKDADLSSFEIIPKELNCNKSPVVHIEHNLGLESWCATHVYDHAHRTLIAYRRQPQPQQQRTLQQQQQSDALAKYLNVALLINPDVTTFWHIRRQLVQKNRLSINKELQFTALVLSKKPKSNEAFAYRRWLYSFQSADAIDWPNEIGICERSADRCASNYHAWSHRQWVLQNAPSCLLQSEIMRTEKFIRKHISDYSSYHYRQVVVARAYESCYYVLNDLNHLHSLNALVMKYLNDGRDNDNDDHNDNDKYDDYDKEHVYVDKLCCKNLINSNSNGTVNDIDSDSRSSSSSISNISDKLLQLLLPTRVDFDASAISLTRRRSFLYCCNLAAHDIRLCEDQCRIYGKRDCFELHRRASLKFIVEHCVRLLSGQWDNIVYLPPANAYAKMLEFQTKLQSFDYSSHAWLAALRKSEYRRGKNHRHWCNLHLGFRYEDEQEDAKDMATMSNATAATTNA